jgi:large subunit ribosomal protein L21
MLAVIKTGGKQYKVKKGDKINVEKLDEKEGKTIKIKDVFLVADEKGKDVKIGTPTVKGAVVEAKVLEHGKGKKVRVIKYKPKIRYRKEYGHRQPYTKLEIISIK